MLTDIAGLTELVHSSPADHPRSIEHERTPQRASCPFVEDSVASSNSPVRPVIAQQLETQRLLLGKDTKGKNSVGGDGEHPSPTTLELTQMVLDCPQLARTDTRKSPREEVEHDRATAQGGQGDRLAVLVSGSEVRSDGAERGGAQRRGLRGRTSLLAAQSDEMAALLVSDSPAVTAPSASSAASTYPSRPTFGVISQM